ncbi:SDR family oxidoreductase [Pseudophaeobacter sp.]|jgi:NAD(P)-dependent dehydrogenase (short-subunit alcohol dehydrogenase family)|uniref:SDR family oxidoreductase n=1 Tax=Pseudophaeobacter sp. TaxID=1971739 RepID=UPI0025F54670|nr:SDR family oxidoreductase [uncultured Pseudophaeobacter sp.]
MDIKGSCIVVTGAGHGIGKGLAEKFADLGAAHVICADIDLDAAKATADHIGGVALHLDAGSEDSIKALIDTVEDSIAPIDLFCSNAGILTKGGFEVPNDEWQKIWDINVMSHVWASRHLVPLMLKRGGGYMLNTASAAGLLNQIGAAPYGVTKHAAVGFAEWLAITYGDQGIGVSVLCPQAVRSEMTRGLEESVASLDGLLEPDMVADCCVKAIENNEFLVLPHPQVKDYMQAKTSNYGRWITGMQRLRDRFGGM